VTPVTALGKRQGGLRFRHEPGRKPQDRQCAPISRSAQDDSGAELSELHIPGIPRGGWISSRCSVQCSTDLHHGVCHAECSRELVLP
jgi:hypothetical protein